MTRKSIAQIKSYEYCSSQKIIRVIESKQIKGDCQRMRAGESGAYIYSRWF